MKRMTKLVLLVLSLVMVLSVFAACDDKKNGGVTTTTTTTNDPGTTTQPLYGTDPEGFALPTIPDELNYGGKQINLLVYSQNVANIFPEALREPNTHIQNEIFLQNQQMEIDLGLRFNVVTKSAHMSSGDDGEDLYNEALEGRTAYEAICCYSLFPSMMAIEGILYDLNGLEYPTTEMPWFASDIQEYAIMDWLFFINNNSSIKNLTSIFSVFANKVMIANKGLENIEDVVLRGEWTLDKMQQYSRNWASEAEQNPGSVYGVFMHGPRNPLAGFYYGAGFTSMRRDADGMPEYAFTAASDKELIDDFVDKMLALFDSPECGYGPYFGGSVEPLKNATAVFAVYSMDFYGNMPDEETYAIIPMPKASVEQEQYLSCRHDSFDVWCVPNSATDPEIGGVVIEAVAYRDYRYIAPKFWDQDFKYRYSDSSKGVQIFELIRDSVKTDFGRLHRMNLGYPVTIIADCFWEDSTLPEGEMTNIWVNRLDEKTNDYQSRLNALKIQIYDLMNSQE